MDRLGSRDGPTVGTRMKFRHRLQPETVETVLPSKMVSTAARITNTSGSRVGDLQPAVSYPPRPAADVLRQITDGHAAELTLLEWLLLARDSVVFDNVPSAGADDAAVVVWSAVATLPGPRHLLMSRLAALACGLPVDMAKSLSDSFETVAKRVQQDLPLSVFLIRLALTGQTQRVSTRCKREGRPPTALFRACRFAPESDFVEQVRAHLVRDFVHSGGAGIPESLIAEAITPARREWLDLNVETMLIRLDPEQHIRWPRLRELFLDVYGAATGPRHGRLSSHARAQLRKWGDVASYDDFSRIIELMLRPRHRLKLELPNWEGKQLKSRSLFWSHFTGGMGRLRILLPPRTRSLLAKYLPLFSTQDIHELEDDRSPQTEVAIFELGDHTIVEMFRGDGSEMRLFRSTKELAAKLFEQPLGISDLRAIPNASISDHKYLWQVYCLDTLSERGLYPDIETLRIAGVDRNHNIYHRRSGLPRPSADKVRDRETQLGPWRKRLHELEDVAKRDVLDAQLGG